MRKPREYDGYYWIGPDDIRDGGMYIGVEGDLTGHIVVIVEGGRTVDSRVAAMIPPYTTLTRWREIIASCGWLKGVVGTYPWRMRDRKQRRAMLIEAFTFAYGTDPANEFPEWWRIDVGPDMTLYEAVEWYIR